MGHLSLCVTIYRGFINKPNKVIDLMEMWHPTGVKRYHLVLYRKNQYNSILPCVCGLVFIMANTSMIQSYETDHIMLIATLNVLSDWQTMVKNICFLFIHFYMDLCHCLMSVITVVLSKDIYHVLDE